MRQLGFGGIVAMLVLSGCASDPLEPTPAELKARWDAQNVYPSDYKTDLLSYMRTYLNDPIGVRGAEASTPFLKSVGAGDRYVVCVRYNARNTDGKYMGMKVGAASYVSAKLDRFFDAPVIDVRELCKEAVYAPFPELERLAR